MARRAPLKRPAAPVLPALVVADDVELSNHVAYILQHRVGLPVVEAETGKEGLSALNKTAFAIVLLDLRLFGEDILDVVRRYFRFHPEVPVVGLVEEQGPEEAAEIILAGAAHLIAPPFTPDRIEHRVRGVLDKDERARDRAARVVRRIENAHVALHERRLEAAAAHARRALALDAARPEPFNVLGVVAQLGMEVAEAQRFYRTALALDDQYRPAQHNLDALSAFPRRLSTFVVE